MLYGYLNSPFVSNPFSDAAIPPSSVASPVISGSGVIGQTLSTTNGTWSGTLPITYTYQWNRNGSIILGATFNTYTLVTADGSTSITCTVTATNAGGSLSKSSNAISVDAAGDADANAFIAAAAITNPTQKSAIDKLVVDLKGYGIWTKMKALYPFVGGTAAQHKFNLKNPIDSDAAFRLTFNGGWTHSSNGALPNGTNAYADTFFIPNNVQTLNSNSIGAYSGNVSNGTERVLMGSYDISTMSILYNSSTLLGTRLNLSPITSAISGDSGLLMASKTDATTTKLYKNSTLLTTGNSGGLSLSTLKILLGTMSFGASPYSAYSINQLRLAFMADGFDSTEQANLYTAIQAFQTSLSRNV
jgi:hypothetical protein